MKHFLRVKRYLLHIYHNVVDLYAGHGAEGTERDTKQKMFSLPHWKDDFSEGLCKNSPFTFNYSVSLRLNLRDTMDIRAFYMTMMSCLDEVQAETLTRRMVRCCQSPR